MESSKIWPLGINMTEPKKTKFTTLPQPKLCECGPEKLATITTSNNVEEPSIPETVTVIGKVFRIVQVDINDHDGLDEEADGNQDRGKQVIKVRTGRAPDYIKDTVIHELIHAIDESLDLGMKEKQVARLATGLLAVLNDNPELKEYILND